MPQRVLVVDSLSERRQRLVQQVLAPAGYHTLEAERANVALALCDGCDLLLAYHQPLDALNLLGRLRADGSAIPFIVLTAQGGEALAVRAFREGASDYLSEPFTTEVLLRQTHIALERRPERATVPDHAQRERDKLEAVLRGTEDPVLLVDDSGRLLLHNAAARSLFGIPDGYAGPAEHVVDDGDIRLLLAAAQPQRAEVAIDDQHVFIAQMTLVPGVGRVIVMHNISALKELDRLKADFVASVSQDLRSPLTAILGYVELLTRAGPVNDQQRLFIDRIALGAHAITNLITDLLDLSRIETAGLDAASEVVNLAQAIEYALATVEGDVRARQQRLTVQLDTETLPVFGSPQRLKQMARNLVQNAVQYTPEGGSIGIRLQAHADLLVLQVEDTGIGIPLDEQQRVFEKFYRATNVQSAFEGSGLGLAIVKRIVDQHGGRLWVESQPGQGSMFTVILPAYRAASTASQPAGTPRPAVAAGR